MSAGGGLSGYFEYNADLFEPDTIRTMARNFSTLIDRLAASPDQRIGDVDFLSADDRSLLAKWGRSKASPPTPTADPAGVACVHERVEAFAARDPQRLAVAGPGASVTYGEMNRRANQLARHLRRRGVVAGSLVGVLLDRSPDLVVAMLAILKAGAAYVPLEPRQPGQRLSAMLSDAMVPLLVSTAAHAARVSPNIPRVNLDADAPAWAGNDDADLGARVDGQGRAYVIFTSGSTGTPRGVEVQHAALGNLVRWHQREYAVAPDDRASLCASPGFDASVWEAWPYLTAGASLHVPPAAIIAAPTEMGAWLAENAVTLCFLPTPVAEAFVAGDLPAGLRLRALLTGGDRLRRCPRAGLPFRFVNHYGPTENAVVATACDVPAGPDRPPAIGRPIDNVTAHVLDRHLQPVPIGARGELFLGGAGLARGYLNDPELTARRFVRDPFDPTPGARLYRTGDVVRWRRDGNLEFHGRADAQVKLRGIRVEPGEIEAALDRHPRVHKSLVVAEEDAGGDARLRAYVVRRPDVGPADGNGLAGPEDERVAEWKRMYETVYRDESSEPAARGGAFDIVGWNSSYTGEPLGEAAMREQVVGTLDRVRQLIGPPPTMSDASVLELGCGTGLLLLSLAGQCGRYVGTDFSVAALAQVAAVVRERGWTHVQLLERRADDDGIPGSAFDVVVLNSVVQYFPSVEYLRRVLRVALRAVRPGGHVFLGDVRCLPLLPALHAGVELTRASDGATAGQVRERANRRTRQEPELLLDPQLLPALVGSLAEDGDGDGANNGPPPDPLVVGLSVQLRRGHQHNELSRFRYDVVLRRAPDRSDGDRHAGSAIGPDQWAEQPWEDFTAAQPAGDPLEALRVCLKKRGRKGRAASPPLWVRGVANARLASELEALDGLTRAASDELAASACGPARADEGGGAEGWEPEQFWALGAELPYEVQVTWSWRGGPGCFDVLFVPRRDDATGARPTVLTVDAWKAAGPADGASPPPSACGNNPVAQTGEDELGGALREHLRRSLPDYMVPAAFAWVDALPLTAAGKLDRRALAVAAAAAGPANGARAAAGAAAAADVAPPGNSVEAKLLPIWQEILGLPRVGVHDNFFDLGGHSLLLVRMHSRIVQQFGTTLSIVDLFRLPTVSLLAKAIADATPARPHHARPTTFTPGAASSPPPRASFHRAPEPMRGPLP